MAESTEDEAAIAFAGWQLERELEARQHVARGAGLGLIALSAVLEAEQAILDRTVDPLGVVLVAYAARGRRLLRAAYRLLDAGEAPEAVPLLRTISEYVIVGRWLSTNPDRLGAWARKDHDKRDFVIGEVMREFGDTDADTTAALQQQRDELAESRRRWDDAHAAPAEAIPNAEQMAASLGLGFAYALAYRTQSQVDVHATTVAVDASYQSTGDGRLRLLPAPRHALSGYDQYELGAHILRDLLATTNAHVRSFLWSTGLQGITAALESLRDSSPQKYRDPEGYLMAASESAAADATPEPGSGEPA